MIPNVKCEYVVLTLATGTLHNVARPQTFIPMADHVSMTNILLSVVVFRNAAGMSNLWAEGLRLVRSN